MRIVQNVQFLFENNHVMPEAPFLVSEHPEAIESLIRRN